MSWEQYKFSCFKKRIHKYIINLTLIKRSDEKGDITKDEYKTNPTVEKYISTTKVKNGT